MIEGEYSNNIVGVLFEEGDLNNIVGKMSFKQYYMSVI